MRILVALTYYKPYISGLTIYAQRVAEKLAEKKNRVVVLTSKQSDQLSYEILNRVEVVRVPALFSFNKGLIMPKMVFEGWKLMGRVDVLNLHLPQFDAFYLAIIAKFKNVPIVTTYQCDLVLPNGMINSIVEWLMNFIGKFTLALSDLIITTSMDYALNSKFLKRHVKKVVHCYTPIESKKITEEQKEAFIEKFDIPFGVPVVGMAGRLATEKGMEVLVDAFPIIQKKFPDVIFLHAGNSANVLGEERYRDYIFSRTNHFGEKWQFLGKLTDVDLSAFYQVCDVLAFPSLNSTEAFGMVQVEAMIQGTPVVASDLPGSRQPVIITGMGIVVPINNSEALAAAIINVIENSNMYIKDSEEIERQFSSESIADFYYEHFQELLNE